MPETKPDLAALRAEADHLRGHLGALVLRSEAAQLDRVLAELLRRAEEAERLRGALADCVESMRHGPDCAGHYLRSLTAAADLLEGEP